ncbi:PstS family phosphate ABC transporter substrate-binding protein [Paenibacillus thermoaerophilus]|uniref:Phosphate-binding protein n=1 Tax=Paenibacillus thermoaerophilus TaxID=1215385 RepID=A0ABW2V3H2_9BACL|nr:PstS family phosphate ABC transporter substrate-binding protein [Paenibacillus thermoaerophilus]
MFKSWKKGGIVLSSVVMAFTMAACGDKTDNNASAGGSASPSATAEATKAPETKLSGSIKIDGSSTVYPISQAVAEEFMKKHKDVQITVGLSGSSNGIKKLISGEITIADSSRKIKDEEKKQLTDKGQDTVEMPVAFDGITVVIHKDNDWAKEMTVEQLKKIWEKNSTVKLWSDVDPSWPKEPIKLYGPGTASGTFEFFTEAINHTAKESRTDFTPSEDDNVLVKGVSSDKYAMAYFGYAYYLENKDKLQAVAIKKDANSPAVAPSIETIEKGTYAPLSRPVFVYPLKSELAKPEVKEFLKFYMSAEGQKLVEQVGYIKLPQAMYDKNLEALK